jgi:iron complex outermembrane receptor protein
LKGRRVETLTRSRPRRLSLASGCVLLAGVLGPGLPGEALAAGAPVYQFHIPAKPAAEALIDFAVQSNLSIGGASACPGRGVALIGAFTIDDGLTRLLSAAGCRFRRVARDTIRILPPEAPARAPDPRPIPVSAPAPVESPTNLVLGEVVVNATKRAAVVDQLPYAVSALSADDLKVAGAVDIDDVAAELPSVSTTNLGPGRDKILMRGLSDGVFTGRTQSTVGIYLDDVPITYNAPDPDIHLGDLDAVEILRGPQGTLYGGGSMSGIYRIVTRPPELDEQSASMRVSGGLTQGGAASDQVEGMANLPIVKDRIAGRLMLYQDVYGGYLDDINLHQNDVDRTVRTGGRGALRADLNPAWTLTLGAAIQSIRSDDTQYITPDLGRMHRANQVREGSSNDFSQAVATLEDNADWGSFRSTTSFVQHKFASRSDASDALPIFGPALSDVGAYDEPSKIDMLVEDAVWTSPNVGRLQWLGGVFASLTQETTDAFVHANSPTGGPAQLLYQEHRTDNLGEAAAYGDATFSFTDNLQATLGARAFINAVRTESDVQAPQSGQERLFSGDDPGSGVSPKVVLNYRLAADELVYASVEEGHRAGGFNTGGLIGTAFLTNAALPGVHQRFGADELWNYEAGSKLSFLGDRLRLRSAVFYAVWSNIQTDQFMTSGLSYTANAGEGHDLGFETEAVMRLTSAWLIQANALVDQPVLVRPAPGFIAGVNLPGVPDLLVGARTEYRFPLPANLTGLVSADARYIGRSQLTFNPLITAPMGGYVLAHLSAQVMSGRWRLAVFLSNPTNEAGNTFSYGNPFNFQQVREVTPQRPRSVRILLSADF